MALIRWRNRELDWPRRAFTSIFDDPFLSEVESAYALNPATDITESEKEITLAVEIPGMGTEDVKVSVENDVLTISGEKKSETERKEDCYHCSERLYGRFERSFSLPDSIDREKISAEAKNGVLTIKLPKTEKAKPKLIQVRIN